MHSVQTLINPSNIPQGKKTVHFPRGSHPQVTDILPGVSLSVMSFTPTKEQNTIFFSKQAAPIDIGYIVQGSMKLHVHTPRHPPKELSLEASHGCSLINTFPQIKAEMHFPDERPVHMVGIEVDHRLLLQEMDCPTHSLPQKFVKAVRQPTHHAFWAQSCTTPQEAGILHQILSCPMEGAGRNLFIQAKCLELIALRMNNLLQTGNTATPRLTGEDLDRIAEAARILESNLEAPPGLDALAARIGMSVTKLKRGFKQVHGSTVYGHLHKYRMETAKKLLSIGQTNISQAAWSVGYTNVGHFSVAFRKYFGIKPRDFLKSSRCFPVSA